MLVPAALNYDMDCKTCSETRTTSLSYTTSIQENPRGSKQYMAVLKRKRWSN